MENESSTVRKTGTSTYITALDSTVNVNSLFMLAVFIGLAWNPMDRRYSLIDDPRCYPGRNVAEDLISFHVFSFASFLFSSLIALSLKQALKISRSGEIFSIGNGSDININISILNITMARVNKSVLRIGILLISAGSVCGCVFLMLALVNLVQVKLGTFSCPSGNGYTVSAIVPLLIFVPAALLINVCLVFYAFTR